MKISCLAIAAHTFTRAAAAADVKEGHMSMIGGTHLQYHPTFFQDLEAIMASSNTKNKKEVVYKTNNEMPKLRKRRGLKSAKSPKSPKSNKSHNEEHNMFVDPVTVAPAPAPTPAPIPAMTNSPSENVVVAEQIILESCDPAEVELLDFPQWNAERGYWIGEYVFLQGDGTPYESSSWNYPYDSYRGFITGEVVGNSYRQRNVFLYPPQKAAACESSNNAVSGDGECGINGNTKIYQADQSATTCSMNEELGGEIEGLYAQGPYSLPTKTELVGADNAVLYQVFIPGAMLGAEKDRIMQSQLTTITEDPTTGQIYRTRTAQGFDTFVNIGKTDYASYYRERKVEKDEFYSELQSHIDEFNIREEDLCTTDGSSNPIPDAIGSFDTCANHLEQSFALGSEE